ncbi:uncharacterized protein mlip isoform 5-T7 [Synchiropus picturatus]
MKSFNMTLEKVSTAPTKASTFSFVPVVRTLPTKRAIADEIKPDLHPLNSTDLTGPHLYPGSADDDRRRGIPQNHAVYEGTTGDMMSEREILTADLVFIPDTEEAGATHSGHEMTSPMYHVTPATRQSENTSKHEAPGTTSMETTVNKHGGISQQRCHTSSGHAEPHKIKSSYKSLAAIPTNTLLLDQQAIDEQVERAVSPCDMAAGIDVDTHAEMCSPAQLRLQSQELYAEIDEILANSNAPEKSEKRASWRSNLCTELQNDSSIPKSLGRETKYASLGNLHPSAGADGKTFNYNKTKPGVIRPMTAIPRLTVEDEEEFHHNPFKQYFAKTDRKKADRSTPRTCPRKTDCSSASSETLKDEQDPGKWFAVRDLQITEPGDAVGQSLSHPGACGTHI